MKSVFDVIKKRYSARNYSSKTIEKDMIKKLKDFLDQNRKGPLGSEVRFDIIDATDYEHTELKKFGVYGLIKGPRVFIAGVVKRSEIAMEDFGYCMEKNILFATDIGFGTCWLGGSLSRSTFAQKMNVLEDELLPAVTPIGYTEEKKTLRENFIRMIVGAKNRKNPKDLFLDNSINTPLDLDSCGKYSKVLEAVRLAPSATNKQPWRIIKDAGNTYHLFMKENIAYNKALGDIKVQNIDMGIAMCHFELVAIELGLRGAWEIKNPSLEPGDLKYIVSWVG
ncbi:UNVERIFIED_CONTAM: Nitroreductase [Acetivibrio alkalicellulosi]